MKRMAIVIFSSLMTACASGPDQKQVSIDDESLLYDQAADTVPSKTLQLESLNSKSIAAFRHGDLKKAKHHVSKALFIDSNHDHSWFNLGYIYYSQKDYPTALAIFTRLHRNGYINSTANFPLIFGDTLCKSGMPNRSVIVLQKSMPEMTDTQRSATMETINLCLQMTRKD